MDDELKTSETSALGKWVALTDLPLLVLALASVPLLVIERSDNGSLADSAVGANWVIWALFALDLVVRTWLVGGQRRRYLARNWFDVAIVLLAIVPIFQPLRALRSARVLRALRSLRAFSFLARSWRSANRLWHGAHGRLIGLAVLVILAAGSVGAYLVERDSGGPIEDYPDALWWSLTTVTTVGYGDMFPITPEGRGIAAFLMLSGVAVFGVVSANLAALFIREPSSSREDELLARIDDLHHRLAAAL